MSQKTYYIETYGCQMNVYDSELVSNMMKLSGYKQTNDLEVAELILSLVNGNFSYVTGQTISIDGGMSSW